MNRIFKIFMVTGPLIIIFLITGLTIFLIRGIAENFSTILINNELSEIIIRLYNDLLDPILGTLMITFSSVGLAAPLGIITGIYLNEYAPVKIRKSGTDLFRYLSSIPSIVIGVFGLVMIISINHLFGSNIRTGIFISAISLSIIILPYIVHSTVNSLSMVPETVRNTAVSLGAKKYQNIYKVLLPQSMSGILGGIVLSIGRAAEDTAVIMLTGAAAFAGIPSGLNDSFEALPFFIYYKSSEYQGKLEMTEIFIASVLIIIISTVFIVTADRISSRIRKRSGGLK